MIILKLLAGGAMRRKLRTSLTVAGMTVAILSFGMLRTFVNAWYTGVEGASTNRLITRSSISIGFSLPLYYKEKIRQVPGVTLVSYGNWFGGIYINEKNFFANFAVDSDTYLDVVPEIVLTPAEAAAFKKDKKAAVAGKKLAERYGWKAGDTITLKGTIFPGDWNFVLRGIYKGRDETVDETMFFFHWDYLNEALKKSSPPRADQVGLYFVKIKDPHMAAGLSLDIDRLFKNSAAETLTETEKAFQLSFVSMTEAILTLVQLVSFIVIFIIMAVMANTMAMSVRERMREYAVLKTLGFKAWTVAALIFGESLVISAAGCVLGILLTYPAAAFFAKELGQYFPIFYVRPSTVYLDVCAALGVAALASLIPAYRAVTVSITEALRRIG